MKTVKGLYVVDSEHIYSLNMREYC